MPDLTNLSEDDQLVLRVDGCLCNDRADWLSEWDVDFLESVQLQLHRKTDLSEKQLRVLERIEHKLNSLINKDPYY